VGGDVCQSVRRWRLLICAAVIVFAAVLGAAPAMAASGGVRIANVTRDRVSLPLTLRGPWRFQMVGLRWRGSGQVEVRSALADALALRTTVESVTGGECRQRGC